MRARNPSSILCRALVICVALCFIWAARASAQEEVEEAPESGVAAEAAAEPAPRPARRPGMWPRQSEQSEKIPLNLKNAAIDNVIDFLRTRTGKTVIRSKDVQAQITIATPEPVSPETAVRLIIDALRLEGVAVLERDDVIQIMTMEKLAEMGVETLAINLKFADVEQVQKLVTPLLAEGVKLVGDSRSRQVLLTGPAEKLADIEKVIRQLDILEIEGTQVRIFQLKYAESTEIATVLEVILRDGVAGGMAPRQRRAPRRAEGQPAAVVSEKEEVAIVAYATANWLVVRAPKEKLEAAEQLIAELDREKPPELSVNVILVQYADAQQVAQQLSTLFRRKPGQRSVRDTVELSADQRANAILVYSTPENFELIKEVLAELDTEESRSTETRSFSLTYAEAADVAEQLNELYSTLGQTSGFSMWGFFSRGRQQQTTSIRFVPEPRTNSLIVIAPPTEFEQIADLIKKLDQPINKTEVSPRIYRIRYIGAGEMTEVLNDIFGIEEDAGRTGGYYYYMSRMSSQEQEVGRLYGKVRFVHEPATNSVIVITNNKENFPIIEDLIEELDRPSVEYANTMVYALENADATDLSDQLNSLFAPEGASRPADEEDAYFSWLFGSARRGEEETPISNLIGKVRVVPDPRTNSLIITTAIQHFEVLRQLIRGLDSESPRVLIRVQLVEITRTQESRIGTRLSSSESIFDSKDFNTALYGLLGIEWQDTRHHTTLTATSNPILLIQFLQREFDSRILSQPSLVVNNNQEATIFVGAEVPFISESQRTPGTTARSDTYDYKKVGTELVIKPNINQKNKVVTTLQITSSQIREGETPFGGYILDTRSYDSQIAVEGGQTIVIGGILRQEETEIIHRVPILGHIPVLSLLFSKKDRGLTTTELIAFITPTVLTTREDDDRVTREEREKLKNLNEWLPPPDAPAESEPEAADSD